MKKRKNILCFVLCMISLFLSACKTTYQQEIESLPELERPEILSQYVYLYDLNSKQVLWDKQSTETIYPASITKLMTGILALEEIEDLDKTFLINEAVLEGLEEANANRAGYQVGDEPTLRDLIYGDLLLSGADCSRALAFEVAGSLEGFVDLMNQKAKELGMQHTHFANTSGLFDPNHYSTCQDLALLFEYCLQNETFVEILSTELYKPTPVMHYHNSFDCDNLVLCYINQENPKYHYTFDIPGYVCGKSGYILESNFSLASYAIINDRPLMLITIDAYREGYYPASIEDAATIFNWFRDHYKYETIVTTKQTDTIKRIRYNTQQTLTVTPKEDISCSYGDLHIFKELPEVINAPIEKGDTVGTLYVFDYNQLVKSVPLISDETIPVTIAGIIQTVLYEFKHDYKWVIGFLLLVLLFVLLGILGWQELRRKLYAKGRKMPK